MSLQSATYTNLHKLITQEEDTYFSQALESVWDSTCPDIMNNSIWHTHTLMYHKPSSTLICNFHIWTSLSLPHAVT